MLDDVLRLAAIQGDRDAFLRKFLDGLNLETNTDRRATMLAVESRRSDVKADASQRPLPYQA